MTDNNGRVSNFKDTILVMTTNAGAQAINKKSIGFSKLDTVKEDRGDALKNLFSLNSETD